MPISKVDVNLERAQQRNACAEQKFYFRRNIFKQADKTGESKRDECELEEMSLDEIVNGSSNFPGCIPLIHQYLSYLDIDAETQCTIRQYLSLIESRANGTLMTTASWIRKFVTNHKLYKHDSRVSEEINYDLMWRIYLISTGQIKCPELIKPTFQSKTSI